MEQMSFRDLYSALGLFSPWEITQVKKNEDAREIHIYIEQKSSKRMLKIFDQRDNFESRNGAWQHVNIGTYKSFIHAAVPFDASMKNAAIPVFVAEQPCFLGHPARRYSNYLRQRVAVSLLYGIDGEHIGRLLDIEKNVVATIVDDIRRCQQNLRILPFVPVESDAVWQNLISDKLRLRTESMPLKYLLSKLKIEVLKAGGTEETFSLAVELREFFIKNCRNLEKEVEQLCGIVTETQRRKATAAAGNRQRLVLPRQDHPVWASILGGTHIILSKNYAFSLFYTQQRSQFARAANDGEKNKAVQRMREYIKAKHSQLRPELVRLNEIYRSLSSSRSDAQTLPGEDNLVWQSILGNKYQIGSKHMGFNLMLNQLKIKLAKNSNAGPEAARQLRAFMIKNRASMPTEIQQVVRYAS